MKINVYEKISKPSVKNTITLKEWFDLIRKSDYSSKICSARNCLEEINALKQILPCVTYNFLYNGYKNDSNILTSTGLIFIDVDNPAFDITSVDKKQLLGYYKSISGSGYHILLRVEGLTKDNFKASYIQLCEELDLIGNIDTKAIKHSQFSLLSFDCDAFYNDTPVVHLASNKVVSPSQVISISDTSELECIPFGSNIKKNNTYTYEGDTGIRYDNLNEKEILEGKKYVVDWDGYEYVRCWIPIHKLKDGRKRFLLSYATNFIWLNPNLHFEKYLLILNNVNEVAFETPLPLERIRITLKTIMRQKSEGKLTSIPYKYKRKIIFNSKAKFERGDKQDIVLQELATKKTDDSVSKIKSMLISWRNEFGVVTARKLFEMRGKLGMKISYKTICKYYKYFKEEINLINDNVQDKEEIKIPESKSTFELMGTYTFQYNVDNLIIIDYWNPTKNFISTTFEPCPANLSLFSEVDYRVEAIFNDLKMHLIDKKELNDETKIVIFRDVKKISSLDKSVNAETLYKQILNDWEPYSKSK